jgi:hypothetical protein
MPSSGEGGLAFGPTLATASRKSLDGCVLCRPLGRCAEDLPGGAGQVQELNG